MGETSTKSKPNSAAVSRACLVGITPICSPSGSITLTSLALMFLLMFVLSDLIGRLGLLGAAMFYLLHFNKVGLHLCVRTVSIGVADC